MSIDLFYLQKIYLSSDWKNSVRIVFAVGIVGIHCRFLLEHSNIPYGP